MNINLFGLSFLWCQALNLGHLACQDSTPGLSYIPSPRIFFFFLVVCNPVWLRACCVAQVELEFMIFLIPS